MLNILAEISCGGDGGITMDSLLPSVVSTFVTIFKIAIPIILVVFGMLDLGKAVMSNDDKVMKEAQTKLIKRVIYAVLVFLIVTIVQVVFGFLGNADSENKTGANSAASCISCFINGPDSQGCKSGAVIDAKVER